MSNLFDYHVKCTHFIVPSLGFVVDKSRHFTETIHSGLDDVDLNDRHHNLAS